MSETNNIKAHDNALSKNTLGVAGIVFVVMAAVAPLTGIVVVAMLAIALGNGGGAAAAFMIIAVVLLLFSIGYAQMSKILISAGGFYAFVVKGLGRTIGLAAGFIATMGFNFFVVGTVATSGFFFYVIIGQLTGFYMPWYIWGLLSLAGCFLAARAGIDFSAKLLGISLVLETLSLIVFDVAVFVQTGFSVAAFSYDAIFNTGSLAIGLLMASTAFLGVEATALFGEEAKDPRKTVPRATYVSICLIGIVLGITTWAVVSAAGVEQAQAVALSHLDTGDLVFALATKYVGSTLTDVMSVLLLVSLTAAMLAFHNAAARYLFSLGRVGVFPRKLARTVSGGVPRNALVVQALFALVVTVLFIISGAAPLKVVVPSMIGFGTLCIIVLQMLAALSIVVWFRRDNDTRWWSTFIAPGIGFICLLWIVVMVILNFSIIAGSKDLIINLLPVLLGVAVIAGIIYGAYLKRSKPDVYDGLNRDLERFD